MTQHLDEQDDTVGLGANAASRPPSGDCWVTVNTIADHWYIASTWIDMDTDVVYGHEAVNLFVKVMQPLCRRNRTEIISGAGVRLSSAADKSHRQS